MKAGGCLKLQPTSQKETGEMSPNSYSCYLRKKTAMPFYRLKYVQYAPARRSELRPGVLCTACCNATFTVLIIIINSLIFIESNPDFIEMGYSETAVLVL